VSQESRVKSCGPVISRYQRAGEGQQTKKAQCLCSELQTVRIRDSGRL
jgi:hypothetical protein